MNDHAEIEGILDRFRQWLGATQIEADRLDRLEAGQTAYGSRPELGLVDLIEEFTALRHELKLQTKSGRGLLDQTETTLGVLRQAIEQFRSVEPREAQAVWARGKVLAEALADLDESLARGRREIEKARRRVVDESTQALVDALEDRYRRQSWLGRRLTGMYHQRVLDVVRDAGRVRRELFDSLLEGYGLIQNRLGRALNAEKIERIPCEGNPVDPERMVVIEVVDDPSRPPGTVLKELRSGYTWKGRLLRYAEVQAVSSVRESAPSREPAGSGPEDHDRDQVNPGAGVGPGNGPGNGNGLGEMGTDFDIETDLSPGAARPDRP